MMKAELDDIDEKLVMSPQRMTPEPIGIQKLEPALRQNSSNCSTVGSSGAMNSIIEFSKDRITIDNVDLYYTTEVNVEWLANKCNNVGRIDSIQNFYELFDGDLEEDCQSILLTFNTLKELNKKLMYYNQTLKGVTRPFLKGEGTSHSSEVCLLTVKEVQKAMFLNTLISIMEQPSRILMLYYLLKTSVREHDFEDFEVIIEFLANLSESRRFGDSLISVLEELTLFGNPKNQPDTVGEIDEFSSLFGIFNNSFFKEEIRKLGKLKYLKLLGNLSWKSRDAYLTYFDQYRSDIFKKLIMVIDCNETKKPVLISDDLVTNTYENTTTGINLVNFIHSSNFGEVLECGVKGDESSTHFLDTLNSHNIVALLGRIVESKNYGSLEHFEVDKPLIENFLETFYGLEQQKLYQVDNIFGNMNFKTDKGLEDTTGFSIIYEANDEYSSTLKEFAIYTSEGEDEVQKNSEFNSIIKKTDETKTTNKNDLNNSKIDRFSAYNRASIKQHIKSTLISSTTRRRDLHKRKFFNPFDGMKRLCCLK